jgi:hypothetical protein
VTTTSSCLLNIISAWLVTFLSSGIYAVEYFILIMSSLIILLSLIYYCLWFTIWTFWLIRSVPNFKYSYYHFFLGILSESSTLVVFWFLIWSMELVSSWVLLLFLHNIQQFIMTFFNMSLIDLFLQVKYY